VGHRVDLVTLSLPSAPPDHIDSAHYLQMFWLIRKRPKVRFCLPIGLFAFKHCKTGRRNLLLGLRKGGFASKTLVLTHALNYPLLC
jgi:hypothetical protein